MLPCKVAAKNGCKKGNKNVNIRIATHLLFVKLVPAAFLILINIVKSAMGPYKRLEGQSWVSDGTEKPTHCYHLHWVTGLCTIRGQFESKRHGTDVYCAYEKGLDEGSQLVISIITVK